MPEAKSTNKKGRPPVAPEAGLSVNLSNYGYFSTSFFAACLASQPAPDPEIENYLSREAKFDPDLWIVEVEDRAGRNFLNLVR